MKSILKGFFVQVIYCIPSSTSSSLSSEWCWLSRSCWPFWVCWKPSWWLGPWPTSSSTVSVAKFEIISTNTLLRLTFWPISSWKLWIPRNACRGWCVKSVRTSNSWLKISSCPTSRTRSRSTCFCPNCALLKMEINVTDTSAVNFHTKPRKVNDLFNLFNWYWIYLKCLVNNTQLTTFDWICRKPVLTRLQVHLIKVD